MGYPKGLLTVHNRPILEHILQTARWDGPTLLVTSPGRESPPGADQFDDEVVDPVAGLGPMRGVLTALESAKTEAVVFAPVDMPSITAEVFQWLTHEVQSRETALAILLERIKDGAAELEPMPSAFRKSARELLIHRLAMDKRSLRGLNGCDGVEILQAPRNWSPAIWQNLNYPHDLTFPIS